ncbi:thaumatin family-domain-containing protein [Lasiosphaeria hispida]|uniref:Thaumatin family-domain-containing protein n=1 Tax=Lasiosphaeria hispida TaxID=260671 RepID=A0AAJ0HVB0_9PEZI|nr:thaumatin family-domain-containing protein [Lasiosphaeria hispida]
MLSRKKKKGQNSIRLGRLSGGALISALLLHTKGCQAITWNNITSNSTAETPVPLIVTNACPEDIWPGIGTQNGIGPGTGGFALGAGSSRRMYVSPDWQGRVWGRTNCSFNADGTGPSNLNGVNGNGASCLTGDCFGRLDCEFTGQVPTTLAEFNLIGGMDGKQTFYDISLVDGYNLPLAIIYVPAKNTTWIPPNLTNCACIASSGYLDEPARSGLAYTNASYPMPYEAAQTNSGVANWCPWDLQEYPPSKPGDGIYPYPDDNIQRPIFDPCLSACASTNSPQDCCTGDYNGPDVCKPSLYSEQAKMVCPDAYSYAFDDQTSTFIIPTGGGWEVVFCPRGRSTNILEMFGDQLRSLASGGLITKEMFDVITNGTYLESGRPNNAVSTRPAGAWLFAMVLAGIVLAMWC